MEIQILKGKGAFGNAQISKLIKLGAGDISSAGISSSIPEEIKITSPEFPMLPIEKESAEMKFKRRVVNIRAAITDFFMNNKGVYY